MSRLGGKKRERRGGDGVGRKKRMKRMQQKKHSSKIYGSQRREVTCRQRRERMKDTLVVDGMIIIGEDKRSEMKCLYTLSSAHESFIVQFTRRLRRNDMLQKARKHRLTTRGLRFSAMPQVFVNEHLFPEIKNPLRQTTKKKVAGWKSLWVRNGQIFPRKTQDRHPVNIPCREDL